MRVKKFRVFCWSVGKFGYCEVPGAQYCACPLSRRCKIITLLYGMWEWDISDKLLVLGAWIYVTVIFILTGSRMIVSL